MKHLKMFEADDKYWQINSKDKFKNHEINVEISMLKGLPDNRDKAKEGDIAIAIWFPDEKWYAFKVEKLGDAEEDTMGLGFGSDDKVGIPGTVYDLGLAYHVIVLK